MNGVFGAGGRVKFGSGAVQQDTKAKTGGLPDLNAALLEQQKQLDELLKKQNAQLKKQDADTQTALENSRQMLRDMENDGLLAKGTADTKPEHLGSFEGLATEVKKTVLGQDAFVDGVVRAMRRPFVLGTEAPVARNVILLSGAPGTGRHFALEETARIMAARGLLQSDKTAVLDLALYPDAGSEKLFCRTCMPLCNAPGEILIFEHYESCYPGFLKTIADLATKSSAPLSSRYLVNKEGILVDGRYRAGARCGEPHRPLRKVPDLLLPQGPGDAGRQVRCALCLGGGGRVYHHRLCTGRSGCYGGAGAERAGPEGAHPAGAHPYRRGRRAGLCGRPVLQGEGRGRSEAVL